MAPLSGVSFSFKVVISVSVQVMEALDAELAVVLILQEVRLSPTMVMTESTDEVKSAHVVDLPSPGCGHTLLELLPVSF